MLICVGSRDGYIGYEIEGHLGKRGEAVVVLASQLVKH